MISSPGMPDGLRCYRAADTYELVARNKESTSEVLRTDSDSGESLPDVGIGLR